MVVDQVLVPSRETGVGIVQVQTEQMAEMATERGMSRGSRVELYLSDLSTGLETRFPQPSLAPLFPPRVYPAGQNPKAEAAESDLALVQAAAASDNRSETEEV